MSSFRTGPPSPSPLSIERVVAFLTPAFAAAAGWLTTVIGHAIPGLTIPKGDFIALFGFGAASALAAALKWLHGRQQFTAMVHETVMWEKDISHYPGVSEIEKALEQHKLDIVRAIEGAVHAPPSVDQIIDAMARRASRAQGGGEVPSSAAMSGGTSGASS